MFSNTFPDKAKIAELVASQLLEIKAVHFNATEPYKFASGLMSPVYIDCRKLISYPRIRSAVMDFAAATILSEAGFEQFDCVAGGETAGIPFAAFLAERLGLPMIYVRKKPKGHGRNAQIEGELREGSRVLVIEDLTTAGGSMFTFIDAIRAAGCTVDHGIALFYYGIFEEAGKRFANGNVELHYLATWRDVLAAATRQKAFDPATLPLSRRFSMLRLNGRRSMAVFPSFPHRPGQTCPLGQHVEDTR
jgi:orotate phosphoribosyltransferase